MSGAVSVLGMLMLAQIVAAPGGSEEFTLRVDVPVVSVDVSVTDAGGRPVKDLTPADFEILDNGVPREIEYFGAGTAPYHTYLLVDVSGSTQNNWDFMNRALSGFVASLAPRDQVAIGVFGHRLVTLVDWDVPRPGTSAVLEPILELEPVGGTTEFYRSLEDVIEDEFEGIRERRAVVVLTDGRDTSLYQELTRRNRVLEMDDDSRFRSLYRKAAESGIAIYFVAVNTDRNLAANVEGADEYLNLGVIFGDSPLPELYLEQVRVRMERLAEVSGGRVFFPLTLEDVRNPFEEIAASLSGAYSLGYTPPDGDSEAVRRIQVRLRSLPYEVGQSRTEYRYVP